jgi:hypothetical protein
LGEADRVAVHRIIELLGQNCTIVWCEDGELDTDFRSECGIDVDGWGGAMQPGVTPVAVIDCDFLTPSQGDLLLDVLDIRASLVQVFVTLPESRRLGLHSTDFVKSDGTPGRWSLEIEKQGYSYKTLIEAPIEEIITRVSLPYKILTYLSMLIGMGYGGLRLNQSLSGSCKKTFRLLPWLCAQTAFPVQILNPLTGCTPDEIAPFMSLMRVMHQQKKQIFLKTRQRWVQQYFGVKNNEYEKNSSGTTD